MKPSFCRLLLSLACADFLIMGKNWVLVWNRIFLKESLQSFANTTNSRTYLSTVIFLIFEIELGCRLWMLGTMVPLLAESVASPLPCSACLEDLLRFLFFLLQMLGGLAQVSFLFFSSKCLEDLRRFFNLLHYSMCSKSGLWPNCQILIKTICFINIDFDPSFGLNKVFEEYVADLDFDLDILREMPRKSRICHLLLKTFEPKIDWNNVCCRFGRWPWSPTRDTSPVCLQWRGFHTNRSDIVK